MGLPAGLVCQHPSLMISAGFLLRLVSGRPAPLPAVGQSERGLRTRASRTYTQTNGRTDGQIRQQAGQMDNEIMSIRDAMGSGSNEGVTSGRSSAVGDM